ncbi:NAD(P)-dependent alcohol dehydrogenase [Inquilinus sp. NPDC058860]|uniref:zinc-dependent alcohol dehydrogenase family protein n=1 Tax=Inquilinus sp. NPDC058860 TaxID=3346652 RepID=UPI0036B28954
MKRWQMARFGRDSLSLVEVAVPRPGPGEILVRVGAVSLNYRDRLVAEDGMGMALQFPFTPGSDMAGTVAEAGEGVTRFAVGDRVLGTFWPGWIDGLAAGPRAALGGPRPGVLAEYLVLPQDWAVAAPRSLVDAAASTLPCAGLTAWTGLVEGGLRAGETVVVQGTGGVALFGLQLARAQGAETIVVSGDPAKLERAKTLGAAHGLDRRAAPGWGRAVRDLTGGRGADHVLELAGGDMAQTAEALAQGGRVALIGLLDGLGFSAPTIPVMMKQAVIRGISVGHRRGLEDLVRAVDLTGLEPVIGAEYGFAELPAALDHLDRGPFGKIVLRVG